MFDVIAFDADDTLWHNESLFQETETKFEVLVSKYSTDDVNNFRQRLFETEMRNIRYFGYGVKSFTLSMVETAIEITDGQIPAAEIGQLIALGKAMLDQPVQLLDQVEATVAELAADSYRLMVITKGDLLHQQNKVNQSGLTDYFSHIEVVSEKDEPTYQTVLNKYGIPPQQFLMIGNSVRSDVLPVVALGGQAIHIPYRITWQHEQTVDDGHPNGFDRLEHIGQLPAYVRSRRHQSPTSYSVV